MRIKFKGKIMCKVLSALGVIYIVSGRASIAAFKSCKNFHESRTLSGHLEHPALFAALNKNSIPNTTSVVGRTASSCLAVF